MQTTAANWHQAPVAKALIARLDQSNVRRIKHVGIPNDYYSYAGTDHVSEITIIALGEIRAVSVDLAFGATFSEAESAGRAAEYIAAMLSAPEIFDVLNDEFAARRKAAA